MLWSMITDDKPLVSMADGEMLEHLGYDVELPKDSELTLVENRAPAWQHEFRSQSLTPELTCLREPGP